jgi:hypothetical protein
VRLTNLPVLDHSPLEALHIYAQGRQGREEYDSLDTNLFAFIMLRLSCPTQESSDVLGHLRGRRGSACTATSGDNGVKPDQEVHTIVVFDKVVEEQARHRYSAAGEVWIVVHSFTYFDTSRRINVTSKEREQVVLPGVVQLKLLGSSNMHVRHHRGEP